MRGQVLVTFIAALAISGVYAAETTSGSITRFGIYEMVGPPTGPWKVGSVSTTTEIPARLGLRFGIDFEISGITEPSAFVLATLTHPPFVKPDGSSETKAEVRMGSFSVNNGHINSVYGFTFDHPYEIVPGSWQIQISYQDHVLAEKTFHVVAAP